MLDDLLKSHLSLVICGTAAGRESARRRAYSAGRGNRFWRILHETGLTDRQLAPEEWSQLAKYGIGLTDIAKHQAGMDHTLDRSGFDVAGLWARIERCEPRILAFNGKAAARAAIGVGDFGRQPQSWGRTKLWVVPSTSGAAAGSWDSAVWHDLARALCES